LEVCWLVGSDYTYGFFFQLMINAVVQASPIVRGYPAGRGWGGLAGVA